MVYLLNGAADVASTNADNLASMKYSIAVVLCIAAVAIAAVRLIRLLTANRVRKPKKRKNIPSAQMVAPVKQAEVLPDEGGYRTMKGFLIKINIDKQNKYMPGRNGYEMARSEGVMHSIVYRDINTLQKMLEEKAGTGEFIGSNKEKVEFGQVIGQYVDMDASAKRDTRTAIIHHSANGAFIVPARPAEGGAFEQ